MDFCNIIKAYKKSRNWDATQPTQLSDYEAVLDVEKYCRRLGLPVTISTCKNLRKHNINVLPIHRSGVRRDVKEPSWRSSFSDRTNN